MNATPGLRERKQARARQAMVAAAIALFTDRGFDAVTVTDIVDRAEVGRSTFFRYFQDKADVLFGDDAELLDTLLAAAEEAATRRGPLDDSLGPAVEVAREAMLVLADRLVEYGGILRAREQLISAHDGLFARSLLRQQRYIEALVGLLVRHGATAPTATLAGNMALACYRTATESAAARPEQLRHTLEATFRRVLRD